MKRLVFAIIAIAAAGAVAWFVANRPDQQEKVAAKRPNVLLVTIDTLRADRVGRGLTPAIDGLAARGRRYDGVHATVPLTLPSHVSLMTGTLPPAHGVRENGVVFDHKLSTIAEVFKRAGYRTGAFVGAYVLNRRFGLDAGFDTYDDSVPRDPDRAESLEAERRGAAVVDAATAWLERSSQPFFAWVHMYDPHAPYDPPADFPRRGGDPYDGEVAYADSQLARLIAFLASRNLEANTIVAVTGDHGESLGEHGESTHGMLVYDGALRVPLVIAGATTPLPDAAPCHQELGMGLLRLAGLADVIPASMDARWPAPSGTTAECGAYSETRYPRRAGWHALTALTDGRWKLIQSSEQELYDLQSDPGETRNLARANPGVTQGMSAALAKFGAGADRAATVAPDAAERLRALGYASGSNAVTVQDPTAPNPSRAIAAWTTFESALGLLRAKRPAEAAAKLKALVAAHPGAPVFHSTYAQALREAGDARGAVAAYRTAVQRWPNDAALFHDLAAAARDAGDVEEAARAEQAALALDPASPMAQNGLGLLHADAGRFSEAVAAFDRATKGDPSNPSYWVNLGNARRGAEDVAGAEAAYRKALELNGNYSDALNGLGVILVQSKRPLDAIPLFERALSSDPQLYEARLNLGIAYQESGQPEKARAAYEEVLKKTPPRYARERNAAAQLLRSSK